MHEGTPRSDNAPGDDVDRLFARLEQAPVPTNFTSRVLASTVARPSRQTSGTWPWVVAACSAVAVLAAAGYILGVQLAMTDGLDLLSALASDVTLVIQAPGDVLAALGQVVSWPMVLLAALAAGMLTWTSNQVAARAPLSIRLRMQDS